MTNAAIIQAAHFFFQNCLINFNNDNDSEDDNDFEEIEYVIMNELKKRLPDKPIRIKNYADEVVPAYTRTQFQMHFRVTIRTFEALCNKIDSLVQSPKLAGRQTTDTRKQLLAVLWLLATPDSYRSVGDRFDLAKSVLFACFWRVIEALNNIAPQVIYWPKPNERSEITRKFKQMAGLDNVVGAVDGTYVPIKAPKVNPEQYINRKCFHAITLQAISIPNLKFINCFTGYPSSVNDMRIFRNSDIYSSIITNPESYFSFGQFIIGDKAYQNVNWCLAPYIDRGTLQDMHINFNSIHAKTRQVVERSFALLFGRFRRLKYLDMNRLDLIPMTILACCTWHNICLDDEDLLVNDYIQEGHGMLVDENDAYNDNLDMMRNEGTARRDDIARAMYENNV